MLAARFTSATRSANVVLHCRASSQAPQPGTTRAADLFRFQSTTGYGTSRCACAICLRDSGDASPGVGQPPWSRLGCRVQLTSKWHPRPLPLRRMGWEWLMSTVGQRGRWRGATRRRARWGGLAVTVIAPTSCAKAPTSPGRARQACSRRGSSRDRGNLTLCAPRAPARNALNGLPRTHVFGNTARRVECRSLPDELRLS